MPDYTVSWRVQSYALTLWSGATGAIKAVIQLNGVISGRVAFVMFWNGGSPPANTVDPNGTLRMNCTFDQFAPMMEMLREEQPVWVGGLLYGWTSLFTGSEPLGEEEGLGG